MPPSFINIINDDNTFSSAISEFNFNQFTYFSGNNNALSDSTPNTPIIITLKSPYKRRKLATSMWQLARDPFPYKAICDSKNQIWYCLMWAYGDECGTRGFGGFGKI